jgi:hypothetical protein
VTKIVEGRMVVTRIKLPIPPMRGEAIVREPEPPREGQAENPK